MSADSKGAIVTHVHELIKAANGFKRYLDVSNLRPENQRHGGFEIEGGQFARDLAAALQRLRDSALPVQVRVGFKALDRLFQGWIERWGWERVIGQDGEAFLAEKQELWAKNEVSWYAAVLSHVEAYSAGEISERPYFGYFESARVAEQKGIAPASPRVTDPRILDAMHNGWVHKPYLATDFPKLKQGEYLSFRDGIQDLQEGIRGYSADAFADQQPTAPRQEPFVVRAPNGVLLGYGEFNAASKIDVDALAINALAEARQVDPMPDPESLTVGEMIDLVTVQERIHPLIGTSKIIFEQWHRRDTLRSASPGFRAFEKFVQRKYGRHASIETANEFRGDVCRRLGKDFDEANTMDLLDALRRLEPPETAPPPFLTPEAPAQPASETKAPEAPAAMLSVGNGKETETPAPEGTEAPTLATSENHAPPSPAIDYRALVDALRRDRKAIQARLVEFMADKDSASCEDVAREVHGDPETNDQAIRMNARRTTEELVKLGSRVSLRVSAARVFKDVSPE